MNRFTTKDGISPLMVAAQASSSGAENCAIALIAAKADPNLINMEGTCPCMYVCACILSYEHYAVVFVHIR